MATYEWVGPSRYVPGLGVKAPGDTFSGISKEMAMALQKQGLIKQKGKKKTTKKRGD